MPTTRWTSPACVGISLAHHIPFNKMERKRMWYAWPMITFMALDHLSQENSSISWLSKLELGLPVCVATSASWTKCTVTHESSAQSKFPLSYVPRLHPKDSGYHHLPLLEHGCWVGGKREGESKSIKKGQPPGGSNIPAWILERNRQNLFKLYLPVSLLVE